MLNSKKVEALGDKTVYNNRHDQSNHREVRASTIKFLCNSLQANLVKNSHSKAESTICKPLLKEHHERLSQLLVDDSGVDNKMNMTGSGINQHY